MKEMIYQKNRKIELLHNDIYKNYHYYILNLGTHPTAYVEIPKNVCLYGKNYNDIDIEVHGGLTYSRDSLNTSENTKLDNSWFIGWDYAHCDDYCGYEEMFDVSIRTGGKKWTTQEIINECENVIEQIINLESMKEKDNLSMLIETLLKIIKEYSLMETSDGKYDIHLIKESESTFGKSYEIIINDRKWCGYEVEE